MKRDRKKLIELFFWGILFLVCMAASIFYMVKDTPEDMETGKRDMELSATEGTGEDDLSGQVTEEERGMDFPSGVIDEGERD